MNRVLALLAVFAVGMPLVAEDSVDGLFEDAEDTVADPNEKVTEDLIVSENIRFFESVKAEGAYIGGWTTGPEHFRATPYNSLNFTFGTDARLDQNSRAYASFYISYPEKGSSSDDLYNPYNDLVPEIDTEPSFSSITVKEIFLDYNLGDVAFFRVGRETQTWGQGRIFNPTNFTKALSEGVGLRVVTTLFGMNASVVAMKNDSYFKLGSDSLVDLTSIDTLGFAAKLEGSNALFTYGLSGFHHSNVGEKAEAYFKTSFAGFDLFGEALLEWAPLSGSTFGQTIPSFVGGLYREWGGARPWLQLQLEYLVSGRGDETSPMVIPRDFVDFSDQSVGVGASSDILMGLKTRPKLSWLTSLKDGSGQLVFGFVNTALPHLDLSAGLVWVYGGEGSRYVVGSSDPYNRRLLFSLNATFAFDIDS